MKIKNNPSEYFPIPHEKYFAIHKDWKSLSKHYFDLKQYLTERHGEPLWLVERFWCEDYPKSDAAKMQALKEYNCRYFSVFQLKYNRIELFIGYCSPNSGLVGIVE